MRARRLKTKPIVYENAPEYPHKKYESHLSWNRIAMGITDLVKNQDLVEGAARSRSFRRRLGQIGFSRSPLQIHGFPSIVTLRGQLVDENLT
jgi:hypothetical protein